MPHFQSFARVFSAWEIDLYVFDFLMNFKGTDLGDALCLGRQGFHIPKSGAQAEIAQEILSSRDPGRELGELRSADGYSEKFLRYLGARSVASLDMASFEGAEFIHDLNVPIPPTLAEKFDFILDGGTLEHVFNIPAAFENVKSMLRVGGLFVGVDAANNRTWAWSLSVQPRVVVANIFPRRRV